MIQTPHRNANVNSKKRFNFVLVSGAISPYVIWPLSGFVKSGEKIRKENIPSPWSLPYCFIYILSHTLTTCLRIKKRPLSSQSGLRPLCLLRESQCSNLSREDSHLVQVTCVLEITSRQRPGRGLGNGGGGQGYWMFIWETRVWPSCRLD